MGLVLQAAGSDEGTIILKRIVVFFAWQPWFLTLLQSLKRFVGYSFMAKLETDSVQAEISAKDYITYKKCWVRTWFWSASKMAENKNSKLTSCVFLYL